MTVTETQIVTMHVAENGVRALIPDPHQQVGWRRVIRADLRWLQKKAAE